MCFCRTFERLMPSKTPLQGETPRPDLLRMDTHFIKSLFVIVIYNYNVDYD